MIPTLYEKFQPWSEKGSVYIVSDTHFDDSDCKYMDENWPSPKEYIDTCLRKLTRNDTLIHLGDVGDPKYLQDVKGYKILIMGNHDQSVTRFQPYFDEIYTGPLMIAEKLILSHEPLDITWAFNIHGHDHSPNWQGDDYHMNCAANVVGYCLTNLKDVIKTGYLNRVVSIHRQTIDHATERKQERMATQEIPEPDNVAEITEFIAQLSPGEYVSVTDEAFPATDHSRQGYASIYKFLALHADMLALNIRIGVFCPHCNNMIGEYSTIGELPSDIICEKCREKLKQNDVWNHAYVIFQKI